MLVGICLGLFIFLVAIIAFSLGIKFGKSNGVIPQLNPIKVHKQNVELKKVKIKEDLLQEGYDNIMKYDGNPQ